MPLAATLKLAAVTKTLLPANGVIEMSPAAVVVKPRAPALVKSGEVTEVEKAPVVAPVKAPPIAIVVAPLMAPAAVMPPALLLRPPVMEAPLADTVKPPLAARVVKAPVFRVVAPIAVLLIPVAVVLKLPAVTSTLLPANGVIEISPAAVVVKPRAPALVNSGEVTEVVADRVVKAPVP